MAGFDEVPKSIAAAAAQELEQIFSGKPKDLPPTELHTLLQGIGGIASGNTPTKGAFETGSIPFTPDLPADGADDPTWSDKREPIINPEQKIAGEAAVQALTALSSVPDGESVQSEASAANGIQNANSIRGRAEALAEIGYVPREVA